MKIPKVQKDKVAIYIDGSNFFKYLKDKQVAFPKNKIFDYKKFCNYLINHRECESMRYYVGIVRNFNDSSKSKKMVRSQQKFLAILQNDGFAVKRGKVMYDKGRIREKGTDVKIAVDLIVGAIENKYDTAIIVSSDTDLIPAIQYIKHKGKNIEYVGFSHAPSFGMQKHADLSILLRPQDIKNFIK